MVTKHPKRLRKPLPSVTTTDDLTNEALIILEGRGFEVRGKTTAQILKIIKRPPTKKPKRNG